MTKWGSSAAESAAMSSFSPRAAGSPKPTAAMTAAPKAVAIIGRLKKIARAISMAA